MMYRRSSCAEQREQSWFEKIRDPKSFASKVIVKTWKRFANVNKDKTQQNLYPTTTNLTGITSIIYAAYIQKNYKSTHKKIAYAN